MLCLPVPAVERSAAHCLQAGWQWLEGKQQNEDGNNVEDSYDLEDGDDG